MANQTQIVPTALSSPKDAETPAVKRARERMERMKTLKLPFCARYLVMRRVNNFTKIAVFAGICTLILAIVKFELALQAEKAQALATLQNTGKTVSKALKLQMEGDFGTLDSVANLWHLDSSLSRQSFREYVLSNYFESNMVAIQTIILIHRIKAQHREAYETDPASIQVRTDCCNGTKYDIPSQGIYCRAKAKNQCNIPGENRFYITSMFVQPDGAKKVLPAAPDDQEHLVVFYQEPLENNPGPTGFDIGSLASRQAAFDEGVQTGQIAVTRRMLRVFAATPEFGMLALYENKTLLTDRVPIRTKSQLENEGREPYAIGSVVAVYQSQQMFFDIIQKIFGREIANARLFLFDDRTDTPEEERLLGMYDQSLTREEMASEMVELSTWSKAALTEGEEVQLNSFALDGSTTAFSVALVPTSDYFRERVSRTPYYILGISVCMVLVAQVERWLGHPWIVSQHQLIKAALEAEIRESLNKEWVYGTKRTSTLSNPEQTPPDANINNFCA